MQVVIDEFVSEMMKVKNQFSKNSSDFETETFEDEEYKEKNNF